MGRKLKKTTASKAATRRLDSLPNLMNAWRKRAVVTLLPEVALALAFWFGDSQMADETTLRANGRDKGIMPMHQDNTTPGREEKFLSDDEGSGWRVSASAETEPGETSRGTDPTQPRRNNSSPSRLFSLSKNPRRGSSAASDTTDNLSSSQQSNMGVDCADIVLNCLFCQLYDIIHVLPKPCERLTNHCWPNYKHVAPTTESTHNDDDDSYVDLDCGFCGICHDASDCLELAMEVSEICYH
nr:myoD family inhibitor domain-containing protein 2 [Nothobranchius furzeri]